MKECRILDKWIIYEPDSISIKSLLHKYLAYEGFNTNDSITIKNMEDYTLYKQYGFYSCDYCGITDSSVVIHHIYGRRYSNLKDHPLNRIPLCFSCHNYSTIFSAHLTPNLFVKWLEVKYPNRVIELKKIAHNNLTMGGQDGKRTD